MAGSETLEAQRRYRNFDDTHRILIEKAIDLIAQRGKVGFSVAALARATGINRTTIYYHFDNRDDLMAAVHKASPVQLKVDPSRWMGVDDIASLIQRNPEMVKAWVDHYTAAGDFVAQYPNWGGLVAQVSRALAELSSAEPGNAEALCDFLLTSAVGASTRISLIERQGAMERVMARARARAAARLPHDVSGIFAQERCSKFTCSVSSS